MPPKGTKKSTKELSMTYSSIKMRELRARRKAEDEESMLQKQRQYQKHYNTEYINIRKDKPVYNDPPFKYEKEKEDNDDDTNEDRDSTPTSDTNEDKNDDTNEDKNSVNSSEQLDEMINDALAEIETDVQRGKNYLKNHKKRVKKKQEKKGNKIPDINKITQED